MSFPSIFCDPRRPTDATGAFFVGKAIGDCQLFLRFQDKLLFFTANATPDRDRDAIGVGGS
jgi:hypothetical protein